MSEPQNSERANGAIGLATAIDTFIGKSVTPSEAQIVGTIRDAKVFDGRDGWEDPVSLDALELPTLPQDVFPDWTGAMIDAVASATETPRELAGMIGLAIVAASCQRKIAIEVTPGYREPLNIWACPALDSGNRKTAVVDAMAKPLSDWEREESGRLFPETTRMESERKTAEARIQEARKQAAKQPSGSAEFIKSTEEIATLEANLSDVPKSSRLWAQDVTPEELGVIMAENGEKMAIISDEGGIFEILGGRYSNGIPNLDLFLKGHAGSSVRVDRRSRAPVIMDRPALTIALSPQLDVLSRLASQPGFRGRGLLARFLYMVPPSPLGHRTGNTTPIPQEITDTYSQKIRALLDIPAVVDAVGNLEPYVLKLSDGARNEWKDFWRAVEVGMCEGERYEYIKDWAGKLPGAAARIAGNLHCAEHPAAPWGDKVSADTMKRALALAAVLSTHALVVFDLMGADPSLDAARKVWRWIQRERKSAFTKRDCAQALKGTFKRIHDLEPAFEVLKERFYIADAEDKGQRNPKPSPGRPSPKFQVNPKLTVGWPQ